MVTIFLILSQIFDDDTSTEARQEGGGSARIHHGELMTLWVYDEKFPTGTHFLFGMLLFTT
jgi:hypothetical protein